MTLQTWKQRAGRLKAETYALYLAYRDPRVPWYARVLAAIVVAYAFSPIDLIPDFIPVLGYMDDLILIPLGVMLVLRLIPPDVMAACRARAAVELTENRPVSRIAAFIIIALWLLALALLALFVVYNIAKPHPGVTAHANPGCAPQWPVSV